ncbi:MAG: hypothetical protein MZW92_35000 [Comamonadaceae bacterium]|nr:hypothetical protein [Comamonadaceae bacterium]
MVQLSAFNTPQFDWGRTDAAAAAAAGGRHLPARAGGRGRLLGGHAPAARGLGRLARGEARILGTRLVPGLLDRLLGRTAVDGQMKRRAAAARAARQPLGAGGRRPRRARPLRRPGAARQHAVRAEPPPRRAGGRVARAAGGGVRRRCRRLAGRTGAR